METALIAIESGEIERGSLPVRAARMVKEWTDLHRSELKENWARAQSERPLLRVPPL